MHTAHCGAHAITEQYLQPRSHGNICKKLQAALTNPCRLPLQLPGAAGHVEYGCTWLHGLEGHPLYELALQHNLMTGHEAQAAGQSSVITKSTPLMHATQCLHLALKVILVPWEET